MPRPTPKPSKSSRQPPTSGAAKRRGPILPPSQVEDVNPIWLLKAIGGIIALSLLCGYLTLCYLFYQGQWQLVLHPSRTAKPATSGEVLHFAPDDSAVPQLTGLWIPAAPDARYANLTLLCLSGGDGSRSDLDPTLQTLHTLGLNLFAFDYRGYGQSAAHRPGQQSMAQDAAAAWQYLTVSRAIPSRQIILYGTGVGASLATQLAASHPEVPAIILESPRGDLLDTVLKDPRSNGVPVRLLFHDRFPLAAPLRTLVTPKLLFSTNSTGHPPAAFSTAANPKTTVELAPSVSDAQTLYLQGLNRFLDQYLPQQAPPLLATPSKP